MRGYTDNSPLSFMEGRGIVAMQLIVLAETEFDSNYMKIIDCLFEITDKVR